MKRLWIFLALCSALSLGALLTFDEVMFAGGEPLIDVASDGSDGSFVATENTVVDLRLAPTATWNTPSPSPGSGVYDPDKWAVVFKYSEVDIVPGVTVTFINHPSRAPVVWLVEGDVTIEGTVNVDGGVGTTGSRNPTEPGPGGFRGGFGYQTINENQRLRSAGLGPGGGSRQGDNGAGGPGSYGEAATGAGAGRTYGNDPILPMVGGSGAGGGGGGGAGLSSGGGGGGAVLIASGGVLTVQGTISANGGTTVASRTGGGSGGAIRLIGRLVQGSGTVRAAGGTGWQFGGSGRIRVEAFKSTLKQGTPPYTFEITNDPAVIWPPDLSPQIRIAQISSAEVGGLPVPADPRASFLGPLDADVLLETENAVTVELQAENVPVTHLVTVRVVPRNAEDFTVPATLVSGDSQASVWEATFVPPQGFAAVQALAEPDAP